MKNGKKDTVKVRVKRKAILVLKRDVDMMQLIANQTSREDIGKVFGVKKRTVEDRIYNLCGAIGCRSEVGVLVLFFRNGLIK